MIPRPFWLVLSLLLAVRSPAQENLVRFSTKDLAVREIFLAKNGGQLSLVSKAGQLYKWTTVQKVDLSTVEQSDKLLYAQPNYALHLLPNPSLEAARERLETLKPTMPVQTGPAFPDNPLIEAPSIQLGGSDPYLKYAWGIFAVGANIAWKNTFQGKDIVVAVTDTGVDYNHQDLIANMWRNGKEIPDNGIDEDGNGFVDDVVGWDFVANDNRPYDLSMSLNDILYSGGNPGHGTHVAGVIGAVLNNALGTSGVAPQVKIMALRFLSERGQGTTETAVQAIDYAVANGAHVINASWCEDKESEADKALQEAILRAKTKGVLFVAAAGNGRLNPASGKYSGFDNDRDAKPMAPAFYDLSNMIAVAAIDSRNNLADFSNWGAKSVKVGAPGVKVFSTVPGNRYQDTIANLGSSQVTWDGTSMAAPFVTGALAVIWSTSPGQSFVTIRQRLLQGAFAISSLAGKVATNGRIDLKTVH